MGGDQATPSAGETTASQLQAYTQYLPGLMQTTASQILPYEQQLLEANKVLAPQQAQLQTDLYDQYGSELNRVGADIQKNNALSQAQSDLAVISGPGRDLVQQGIDTQKLADPEYYANRALAGQQVGNLLNSINVNGLSGSERSEMERALAQQQNQRGIAQAPSNISTLEAANTYGSALQNKRNALSSALDTANQFLTGGAKSGVDAFQVATGRASQPNPGNAQFTGINPNTGQQTSQLSNSFLQQTGENARQTNDINSQRRDSLDRVTGVLGSLPSIS